MYLATLTVTPGCLDSVLYCTILYCTVLYCTALYLATLTMTPGWLGSPHPMPQLTTPARCHRPSPSCTLSGPPESPSHESRPPSLDRTRYNL